MYENIPQELKEVQNWVCWNFEQRNGKTTKIPKNPHTGKNAQSNNRDTWSDFNTALQSCSKYKHDGIGFMFTAPYFGVDLDKCIENKEFVEEFVNTLDSYTEYSVSKNGIHIICKGNLPEGRRRKGIVEMYEKERFFVMTGDVYGNPRKIKDCTENIKTLHKKYVHADKPKVERKEVSDIDLTADEILKIAFKAKNGKEIEALYRGNFSSYPSQSEADLALCNHLAFYTHSDYNKMDMLFRSSGLMREKWNEMRGATTYGQKVLNEAIDNCKEYFKPNQSKNTKKEIDFNIEELTSFPFPKEVYAYLSSIENAFERESKIQEVQEIANSFKKKREFDKLLKSFTVKDKKNNSDKELKTEFGLDEELNCGHWIADEFGIKTETLYGDQHACYNPIYPVKILHNIQTDKQKVTLRYKPNNLNWQTSTFDRSVLSTTAKIMALTDFGIRFTSENAKYLCKYLTEIETYNKIDLQYSTSKLGWHNEFTELMPFSESNIILDIEDSFKHIMKSMKSKGSEEKYLEFYKRQLLGDRKEPVYMILASLASILVQPLGCLPFITHLYGQAGRGKTLCSMVACAVWGNPSDNGYMADPKNTITGFEVHLDLLNNLPFICDDLNKIIQRGQQDHSQFIYMLCSGRGKQRSNVNLGLEKPKTWQNISITNGEKSITTSDSHGGEMLRTIEIEMQEGDIFNNGRNVANFLRENYGFLGKKFTNFILSKDWEYLKNIQNSFIEKIVTSQGGDRKEGKQVQSVALLMTTAKLLAECLGIKEFLDFKHAYDLIYSMDDVSDVKRAYNTICDLIEQNRASFVNGQKVQQEDDREPLKKWGWFVGNDTFILISHQFKELCNEANIDRKLFVKWCIQEQYITNAKREDGTNNHYIMGDNAWGVKFTINMDKEF